MAGEYHASLRSGKSFFLSNTYANAFLSLRRNSVAMEQHDREALSRITPCRTSLRFD
jgi:hypothetical protein